MTSQLLRRRASREFNPNSLNNQRQQSARDETSRLRAPAAAAIKMIDRRNDRSPERLLLLLLVAGWPADDKPNKQSMGARELRAGHFELFLLSFPFILLFSLSRV